MCLADWCRIFVAIYPGILSVFLATISYKFLFQNEIRINAWVQQVCLLNSLNLCSTSFNFRVSLILRSFVKINSSSCKIARKSLSFDLNVKLKTDVKYSKKNFAEQRKSTRNCELIKHLVKSIIKSSFSAVNALKKIVSAAPGTLKIRPVDRGLK